MNGPLYDKTDPESIETYAKCLIDKSLREVIGSNIKDRNLLQRISSKKGNIGMLLEKHYFKIRPGNESIPDFPEAGVELKSTPLKLTKHGLWAKERLVLSLINYMTICDEKWHKSSFLKKNALLLIIFYLHEANKLVVDLVFDKVGLWRIPENDINIIKRDWQKIVSKIKEGRAHELSEGDTLYLGACTKAATSKDRRRQPYSSITAKPRAFSFKHRYVNYIIREFIAREKFEITDTDKAIKDPSELKKRSFESIIESRFSSYLNKSTKDIISLLHIKANRASKNINDIITRHILGIRQDRSKIEEFDKANITIKSIVFDNKMRLRESISFPYFDYVELSKEKNWYLSRTREMYDKKFMFVIYVKDDDGEKILKAVKFWNIPTSELDTNVKWVWKETIKRIKAGKYDALPRMSENRVAHVRPHGANSKDTIQTPDGKRVVKKCFWLNAQYIASVVSELLK